MYSNELMQKTKLTLSQNLNFCDEKLKLVESFVKYVLNYNEKYNLISRMTEKHIWDRHVLDSAQLVNLIDHKKFQSLSDLGTGGGFPGIILSIFYLNINKFHVKLFEKSKVKVEFLRDVIEKLSLKNVEIYDNDYQYHKIDTDYLICRAFKKLPEILRISREIAKKPHKLIVMLGKSAQDQLNKASKDMIYKYKLVNSITSTDSKILVVDAIK